MSQWVCIALFFTMHWLILPFVFVPLSLWLETEKLLAQISLPLHRWCVAATPTSQFSEFTSALVCGSPLSESPFKFHLQSAGLIHLIVVSGSHLLFVEEIFSFLLSPCGRTRPWLLTLILTLYALLAGGEPPVIRALISLGARTLVQRGKLHWPGDFHVLVSGVVTLALFPRWITSYSLMLSWGAALALSQFRKLSIHFAVYLILFPILLPLAPPHPLSIFFNLLLTPILGLLLFPLCLLNYLLPPLTVITDALWESLSFILKWVMTSSPITTWSIPLWQPVLWIYLLLLHIGFHQRRLILWNQKI